MGCMCIVLRKFPLRHRRGYMKVHGHEINFSDLYIAQAGSVLSTRRRGTLPCIIQGRGGRHTVHLKEDRRSCSQS